MPFPRDDPQFASRHLAVQAEGLAGGIDRRYCTTGLASYDRPHIVEEAFLLELR